MAYSPRSALSRAKKWSRYKPGLCLQWVRKQYGVGPRYPHATSGWQNARYKRKGSRPPAGYPVWWTGGSRGFGHVAVSAGNGYVISTDSPRSGRVGRVAISTLTRKWGLRYRGWTLDINGVKVGSGAKPKKKKKAKKPTVSLRGVRKASRIDPPKKGTSSKAHPVWTRRVEVALRKEGLLSSRYVDGHFGTATVSAYSAWQRRCGYRGRDADGIPGRKSLKRLGAKHGFRVVR